MIGLDFETFSLADISWGAWRYAEDPSTEILCMAFSAFDAEPEIWFPGVLNMPDWVENRVWENGTLIEAHKVEFEKAIWRRILVERFHWPDIPDESWICTAAKAAAHAIPRSLEMAAQVMRLQVQKNMDGKRVMMKLSQARRPTKNNPAERWTPEAVPEDFETLYSYCRDDVKVELHLGKSLRDLNPKERKIWLLDQKINERGINVDKAAIDGALKIINTYEKRCKGEIVRITNNRLDGVTRIGEIKEWMAEQGVHTDSLDKASVENLLVQDIPDNIRRLLELRQSLGKTSVKKINAMKGSVCRDGRIRSLLMYHGAGPGRWAGKGIQIQNFPRRKVESQELLMELIAEGNLDKLTLFYGDPMDTISSALRGYILPSNGEILRAADYNAIEARGVCWLADQKDALRDFHEGKDRYREMARLIYGYPDLSYVDGGQKDGPQRQLGKQVVLGCGYQMGADRFKVTCEGYGMEINEALAQRAVDIYRDTHPHVKSLWWDQESAAKEALKTRKPVKCGKVVWGYLDNFLFCRLPSGRAIAYREPKIVMGQTPWGEEREQVSYMGVDSKTKQWVRERTYGGKLVENITQGVARDIMAEAMLRVEEAGYKILFTVHDEVVVESAPDFGSTEHFVQLLSEIPEWAAGFPVKVEGWSGERYRK